MATTQTQLRRGSTAAHAGFTGAEGELTIDTTLDRPVVHDAVQLGGFPVAMLHVANIFSNQQRITTLADEPQLIITTAPGQSTQAFQIFQPDGVTQLFGVNFTGTTEVYRQMASTTGASLSHFKRGTTGDATAAVASGDQLAQDNFFGWTGASFAPSAQIRVTAREAFTPTTLGSQFEFRTPAIGSAVQTLVATLNTEQLELSSRLLLPNTTSATVGGIYFGGNRAFHNFGTDNIFAGVNTGNLTLTGTANSFFGYNSGTASTTGGSNSFFGFGSGRANTTGASNSFFGRSSGYSNTTGSSNSFFGLSAGLSNTTASFNSFFGNSAGQANTTGAYNSFFGANSGLANTTGNSNAFSGSSAGLTNTTGSNNSFFGRNAGRLNTTGAANAFFGRSAGFANTTAANNAFFGAYAGLANTTGAGNAFFGRSAGAANLVGNSSAFFGMSAGAANTGSYNNFFGANAGLLNTTGTHNCFFGTNTGDANISGIDNSFFGNAAGGASTGNYNSFFGRSAGLVNSSGGSNSFFGHNAGVLSTTGSSNSFFGRAAGDNLTAGSLNIVLGANIDVPTSTSSNTLTIGNLIFGTGIDGVGVGISTGNIGIAVINPHSGLQVGRSFALPYRAIVATDTFAATDYTIDATSGTFTVNLPTAVGITGRIYVAKNSGLGTITLDPAGAELIDSLATATIVSGASITTQSTGTGWIII